MVFNIQNIERSLSPVLDVSFDGYSLDRAEIDGYGENRR
jgi:hypothetical protein